MVIVIDYILNADSSNLIVGILRLLIPGLQNSLLQMMPVFLKSLNGQRKSDIHMI